MGGDYFTAEISRRIWETRYRWHEAGVVRDVTVEDTWRRVARALASAESSAARAHWEQRFYSILEGFRFLPGGRILAGAGTGHRVTLFNCFVMGTIVDSLDSIFDALKEGALTMQQGGGVGYDFSTLRPSGTPAVSVGVTASGPVSFMEIWDAMCATILSTGARRGAMMATLRCDHPDIELFVRAKHDAAKLRHFNLSVQVTDAFMQAVRDDTDWALVFPLRPGEVAEAGETVERVWSGSATPVRCRVRRHVRARALWNDIMQATYDYAEPGVIFIDRVNAGNNLWYAERISATNPCGEIPLPPYGACDLGSINLTQFVRAPFSGGATLDMTAIEETTAVATRLLDNVTDVSRFPLPQQEATARSTRRLGLGITGLGDALIMLGQRYGSEEALRTAGEVMRRIAETAYRISIDLAQEKGVFARLDREQHLKARFIEHLPADIRDGIARHGIRNSHLTAIAPTGTISLFANNVSSGLEPVYRFEYTRRVREADGSLREHRVQDAAYRLFRGLNGPDAALTPAFVTATEIPPALHLDMQAALQPWVDNAISKTVNVPPDYSFEQFRSLYDYAYEKGLKGCTTFRPNAITGQVLVDVDETPKAEKAAAIHCCSAEREAD
ncbi:MAG: adenosylcobalamin-dependent ribonucleoside-diphosphate reductase [Gammaproteobacteria bacterium]|nr:adenosylcobalamin-dependent ribonucleoside-diphosphate reductase [Gammaproteobacteria bacterium]